MDIFTDCGRGNDVEGKYLAADGVTKIEVTKEGRGFRVVVLWGIQQIRKEMLVTRRTLEIYLTNAEATKV
jgi:hypothetical protein